MPQDWSATGGDPLCRQGTGARPQRVFDVVQRSGPAEDAGGKTSEASQPLSTQTLSEYSEQHADREEADEKWRCKK